MQCIIILQTGSYLNIHTNINLDPSCDMSKYENRLNTYKDWKLTSITPAQMANAGFYYLSRQEIIKCEFCSIEFTDWIDGQDPLVEHKRLSPDCTFLKESGTNPSSYGSTDADIMKVQDFLFDFGVESQNVVFPYSKKFTSYDVRVKTFENCKRKIKQDISTLCRSGLYYIGDGENDMMICFCCNKGLMSWADNEDPWIEHARWSPNCSFILLTKGNDFVKKTIERFENMNTLPTNDLPKIMYEICSTESDENLEDDDIDSENFSSTEGEDGRAETTDSNKLKIFIPKITLCLPQPEPVTIPDALLCKICFKEKLEVLFIPCGHVVACIQCAVTLDDCAICRQQFLMTMTIFIYTNEMGVNDSDKLSNVASPTSVEPANATVCKVCQNGEMGVVFIPCRHISCCFRCSLKDKTCPVCFEQFFALIQVFL